MFGGATRKTAIARVTSVEPIHDREDWGTEAEIHPGTLINGRRIFQLYLDPRRLFHFAYVNGMEELRSAPDVVSGKSIFK